MWVAPLTMYAFVDNCFYSLFFFSKAPNDWTPNHKVKKWLQKLNAMRAVDQIDEDDSRQLYLDLDSAYSEFTRYLKRNK
jgi:ESCRT-I complex subunit VPS28